MAVVFLYQMTVFLQQNTTASLLELYFNDSMQTVLPCGGGGGGSQRREVADGADVVFTDTADRTVDSGLTITSSWFLSDRKCSSVWDELIYHWLCMTLLNSEQCALCILGRERERERSSVWPFNLQYHSDAAATGYSSCVMAAYITVAHSSKHMLFK